MSDSILKITSKACCKCKQIKDLSMFSKNKRNPGGYCNRCKSCDKEYYEENKERSLEYYQQNKDRGCTRAKVYYQQNKDKIRIREKAYRQENKDKIRIRQKAYHQENKDKIRIMQAACKRDYAKRHKGFIDYELFQLLKRAKRRARRDNLPFDLTIEWLRTVVVSHCPITLQPIDWTKEQVVDGKAGPNSPSIDKNIPKLGYIQSNCAIISHRGNTIKSNGTIDEHLRTARYMAAQQLRDIEF
jgi:hypothetical protein